MSDEGMSWEKLDVNLNGFADWERGTLQALNEIRVRNLSHACFYVCLVFMANTDCLIVAPVLTSAL